MKITNQETLFAPKPIASIRELPAGTAFKYQGKLLLKLKPTQFLLNSSLVADVLNRADCFVANIETGTLYIMEGDKPFDMVDATLLIKES